MTQDLQSREWTWLLFPLSTCGVRPVSGGNDKKTLGLQLSRYFRLALTNKPRS